jgi:hypothetical protein
LFCGKNPERDPAFDDGGNLVAIERSMVDSMATLTRRT